MISTTDGVSIGTIGMLLIYEELQIKLHYKSNYLQIFSPFKIVLEDYTGKSSEVVAKNYTIANQNDSVSTLNIPLADFKLIEKQFTLDRMKQFTFVGDENGGSMVIYEMKLVKNEVFKLYISSNIVVGSNKTVYDNPEYTLVFEDNFRSESIDESKWNFEIGTRLSVWSES